MATLPKGLFEGTPNLASVHLDENPFVCDCKIFWLSKWLDDQGLNVGRPALCMEPFSYQGQRVVTLYNSLTCEDFSEADLSASSCSSAAAWTCPSPCKCSEGIADCRNKKLTAIPSHFPEDTTEM